MSRRVIKPVGNSDYGLKGNFSECIAIHTIHSSFFWWLVNGCMGIPGFCYVPVYVVNMGDRSPDS